ncbi:hypothetical protein C8R45DRAFT_568027 [Mycena sanguinolenta]|nr:hypothetical protein C8R45DRAFT_568027 [Mycena sanguinolenta]
MCYLPCRLLFLCRCARSVPWIPTPRLAPARALRALPVRDPAANRHRSTSVSPSAPPAASTSTVAAQPAPPERTATTTCATIARPARSRTPPAAHARLVLAVLSPLPPGTSYSCQSCLAGTYSNGDNCSACPGGAVSSSGRSSCTTCPDGFVPSSYSDSCQSCPAGSISNPRRHCLHRVSRRFRPLVQRPVVLHLPTQHVQ